MPSMAVMSLRKRPDTPEAPEALQEMNSGQRCWPSILPPVGQCSWEEIALRCSQQAQ